MLQISNFVREAENALKSGNIDDFGELLHESWMEKKKLSTSITNSTIDDIYKNAIK